MAWTRKSFLIQRFKELHSWMQQRERQKWLHKQDPMQFPDGTNNITQNILWCTPLFITCLINSTEDERKELLEYIDSIKKEGDETLVLSGIYRWDHHRRKL
jgi:hypothetical protein